MTKFGEFDRGGNSNIISGASEFKNVRKIAEVNLDADKKRARAIIDECRVGNFVNFMELKIGWDKKDFLQYFRVTEKEWNSWRKGFKEQAEKTNPAT